MGEVAGDATDVDQSTAGDHGGDPDAAGAGDLDGEAAGAADVGQPAPVGCVAVSDPACPCCQEYGLCTFKDGACVAGSTGDCKQASACTLYGQCTASGGKCIAGSDADCLASPLCQSTGDCAAKDGKCVADTDAHCAASENCKAHGACLAVAGTCMVSGDAACEQSTFCKLAGMCSAVNGKCIATGATDCKLSTMCKSKGFCTLSGGNCILADADCAALPGCNASGQCAAKDGTCVASTDADCAKSAGCASGGKCAFVDGACVTTDAYCQTSAGCVAIGYCTAKGGGCVLTSDADCALSNLCKTKSQCTFANGACVIGKDADCAQTGDCKVFGWCTFKDSICTVGGDADCVQSSQCTKSGLCKANGSKWCVYGSDSDCAKSGGCAEAGACTFKDGGCGVGSNKDCANALKCKQYGLCAAQGGSCAATTDTDCKQSTVCASYGWCTASAGKCMMGSDADCLKFGPKPKVNVVEGTQVIPQTTLHLKGDASSSPVSKIQKYSWTVKQPAGSYQKLLPNATLANPTFLANVVGDYQFCLIVDDSNGNKSCAPDCVTVNVLPNNALHVELVWDTPGDPDQGNSGPAAGADLDLHFAYHMANGPDLDCDSAPDPWFSNPFDTFWYNPNPNWGVSDNWAGDDPSLDLDDTDGAGPELLNLGKPEGNTVSGHKYPVGVHYWHDHGFGESFATVSIYAVGKLAVQLAKVPLQPLDMWYLGKLNWPNVASGGTSPVLSQCKQSGNACTKAGKMWQASGDPCITPCYENKSFTAGAGGGSPAVCKKGGP